MKNLLFLVLVVSLSACAGKRCHQCADEPIVVNLEPRSNSQVLGTLTLRKTNSSQSINITGDIRNLSPGKHGFHIHEYGDCSAADASSAGGHWALANQIHAGPLHDRSHIGDLGNIRANAEGIAQFDIQVDGICFAEASCSVLGRSFVVHAGEDDLRSQPAGASGDRVACGVVPKKNCCTK